MLQYERAKITEVQGGKVAVQGTNEVFVEPLCLLNLEADPLE